MALSVGGFSLSMSLAHFINDALMAIFFLLIGIEIKREVLIGQLSKTSQITFPAVAAVGGMAAPALIFLIFNINTAAARGWAIPSATDIAFAVGVLALLGDRVPRGATLFLLAVAIIDDFGAIIIIAFFYTSELNIDAMIAAGCCAFLLLLLNILLIRHAIAYLIIGAIMWYFVLLSGIHATLAGVLLALAIPLRYPETNEKMPKVLLNEIEGYQRSQTHPMAIRFEHAFTFTVSFVILPLFAFVNMGIPLAGIGLSTLFEPVALGVFLGLLIGKPVGIILFCKLICKLGVCTLPAGVNNRVLWGLAVLCGIGFTMSLFIGGLSFAEGSDVLNQAKIGILSGSICSAIIGLTLLHFALNKTADSATN